MQNILLLFVEIVVTFFVVVMADRYFKKEGLMAWVVFASVAANIMTAKCADFIGITSTLGTVLFASTYLATDILCERYDRKDANKAVLMGLCGVIGFVIAAQIALLYIPSEADYANESMAVLFGLNLRISLSSALMYALANLADIWLFNRLKKATKGKHLWLRNNVATIVCNGGENFLFIVFAFLGIYSFGECMLIALSSTIIEVVVAICDTPFLYWAKRGQILPE